MGLGGIAVYTALRADLRAALKAREEADLLQASAASSAVKAHQCALRAELAAETAGEAAANIRAAAPGEPPPPSVSADDVQEAGKTITVFISKEMKAALLEALRLSQKEGEVEK